MGDLLKQLVRSLGRYIWYHATRSFRRPQILPAAPAGPATPAEPFTVATPAQISALVADNGLDPSYERTVAWPSHGSDVPGQDITSNPLYRLWAGTPSGHKWSHYFSVYEKVFASRRGEALRILEIGVFGGASLTLWRQYFAHPQTLIAGIDINPACAAFDAPADGIRVRIGSQDDPVFLKRVVEEFGPFDIIIDDGSHHSSHMIASFNILYADGLKDAGIYLVEDLHANYWLPWRDSRRSFLDLCKELAEHMNAHYRLASPVQFLGTKPSQWVAPLEVPLITTLIEEIRIFDSIVAIYKTHRTHIPYQLFAS